MPPTTGTTKKPTIPRTPPPARLVHGTPAARIRRPGIRYLTTWLTATSTVAAASTIHAAAVRSTSAQTSTAAHTSSRPVVSMTTIVGQIVDWSVDGRNGERRGTAADRAARPRRPRRRPRRRHRPGRRRARRPGTGAVARDAHGPLAHQPLRRQHADARAPGAPRDRRPRLAAHVARARAVPRPGLLHPGDAAANRRARAQGRLDELLRHPRRAARPGARRGGRGALLQLPPGDGRPRDPGRLVALQPRGAAPGAAGGRRRRPAAAARPRC